jgi:GNAT superfamily N-acetyltransferase
VADVSVRPAGPADVAEIARIQVDTWRLGYGSVLPEPVLQSLDVGAIAPGWQQAVCAAPSARHHVLVAMEGAWRVGFTAFGPDADGRPEDPDQAATSAITVLLVEPRWGRRGHGSRLLAAVADLAREDGARRLVAWVPAADTASLEFYRSAGWEADGRQRNLDTGTGLISELRLHAALVEAGASTDGEGH